MHSLTSIRKVEDDLPLKWKPDVPSSSAPLVAFTHSDGAVLSEVISIHVRYMDGRLLSQEIVVGLSDSLFDLQ